MAHTTTITRSTERSAARQKKSFQVSLLLGIECFATD
jgi:hypothetical protein